MSRLEMTVEELKSLSPAKFEAAAGYIHQLKITDSSENKRALDRASGCLTPAEADEMERAIVANCERVDASQW
jgi:hypothetical protein